MSQKAIGLQAGTGPDHHRAGVGQHQGRHHHRDHPAAVHRLREQERRERRHQAQRSLLLRRVDSFAQQRHRAADQQPGGDPAEVGADEPGRHLGWADRGPADRDVDADGEQDQGGAVVDEALGLQHGQRPARQLLREPGHRGRVRRRQHRTQDARRVGVHAQRPGRPRHRDRGGDHQDDAEKYDDARVGPDLAEAGVQALPVQDRGKKQQQHDLAVDPDMTEVGDQAQQRADHDEQHRGTHAIAPADDRPHDDGGDQRDDQFEAKHQPILPDGTVGGRP